MVVAELTPKQLYERRNLPFIYFVLRPLGRVCLPFAAWLGVSPNQVTLVSILISLAGLSLLAAGGLALSLAGVAMLHVALVLDMVDGDLARLRGTASRRGEFLDALAGFARQALLLPALGIGVARMPDLGHDVMVKVIDFSPDVYIQVGLWAGFVFLLSKLITLRYRVLIGESLREKSGKLGRVSLNFEDALIPLLVVGAVTQSLSLVVLLYALYYAAAGLYTVVAALVEVGSESSSD